MIPPEEIVSTRVLPTIRAMIATALAERGLTERTIADRLDLTQSAVSKYLRGRVRMDARVAAAPTFRALVDHLVEALGEERPSPLDVQDRLREAIRQEEDRGVVCLLHEDAVPALRGLGCDICVRGPTSELRAEEAALADARSAVRALLALPGFDLLIPNVGSNLARAKEGAASPEDVVAIPGRLFVMRGTVRAPAPPEFGASKHVADVILAVRRAHPSIRAALNVRWDERIAAALESLGWKVARFEAAHEGQAEAIARDLGRGRQPPQVLYQGGAFGIEAIAYLLGETAQEVVARTGALLGALTRRPGHDFGANFL